MKLKTAYAKAACPLKKWEQFEIGAGWEGRTPDIRRVKALLYHWVNPAQIVKDHGRDTRIRTLDPLLPKQMLYQAELHPESQ